MIREVPLIDPRSRLRCDRPNAPDLAALLGDAWVRSELIGAGMPAEDFDPGLPGEERARRALTYLPRMRNTAASWCLGRILRDLYDFDLRSLDATTLPALWDKVAATGRSSTWAGEVVADRAGVATVVTSLGNAGSAQGSGPLGATGVKFSLDVDYLFCPGVATDLEPFFGGRRTAEEYVPALAALIGDFTEDSAALQGRLWDWLDGVVSGDVRFCSTSLPIDRRFRQPDTVTLRAALRCAARGVELSDAERHALNDFFVWSLLGWAHERKKAVQIAVGSETDPALGGKGLPRFQESWVGDMARAFQHFSNARFSLLVASDALVQETAVLAQQFPNVYLAGDLGHNFVPTQIARTSRLRLETTPMAKLVGFVSDASTAEWVYGKLLVAKTGLIRALVDLVADRIYDEDELPQLLHQILHTTPRELYDLA